MKGFVLALLYLGLMRNFLRVIVGVKFLNKENLKKKKQFIIVSNHNSHLDTMALLSSLSWSQIGKTHPVAAGDYFGKSPLKAALTRFFTNSMLIRRSKSDGSENPITQMGQALDEGKSLILFPEGSRGEPEKMQEFKKGIGVILSKHKDIPYIPVFMSGLGKVLPKGEKLLVPFDSYVIFGEPRFIQSEDVNEIVKTIEAEILDLKVQLHASFKEEE